MKGGWSAFTSASTSSQIHYFPNDNTDTRSTCGMASLSSTRKVGKFIKDLETFNEKRICKKCKEKKHITELLGMKSV